MANLWKVFESLVGPDQYQVVKVVSVSNGISTVSDPDGNVFKVLGGSVSAGDCAIVKNGLITGKSPVSFTSIPSYTIL